MAMTNCRQCRGPVSGAAETCPHCGIGRPVPRLPPGTSTSLLPSRPSVWALIILVLLGSASLAQLFGPAPVAGVKQEAAAAPEPAAAPAPAELSEAAVKALSRDIRAVRLTEQVNREGTYLVDIEIDTPMIWGGAQDWNGVANDVARLSRRLLSEYPAAVRINFSFWSKSTNGKPLDWGHVFLERDALPQDWRDLTYLQFLSVTRVLNGTLQTRRWLCEFYVKYPSAAPRETLPAFCRIKD